MDPRRSGVSACGAVVVACLLLALQTCHAASVDVAGIDRAKRSVDSSHSSGQDAIARRDMRTWTLIRDLEEAVFKLKEHLLNVDARSRSSQTDQTDNDVVDPIPEAAEERHLEESYPEVTGDSHDKKEVHAVGSGTQKSEKGDDMSLKDALEFLVSLAKEKKKEENREHDSQTASHQ